ncbi:hypothetical protein ABZ793_32905 [Micromonospora sp. NPDC047465]|uniref:hypothetical protein n=1 Tax=Micromonospora sp. NPDC047465 TaxID=3154813 RepID=UPI0033D5FCC4
MDIASVTVLGSRRQGGNSATLLDSTRAKLPHDVSQPTLTLPATTKARRARESEPPLA